MSVYRRKMQMRTASCLVFTVAGFACMDTQLPPQSDRSHGPDAHVEHARNDAGDRSPPAVLNGGATATDAAYAPMPLDAAAALNGELVGEKGDGDVDGGRLDAHDGGTTAAPPYEDPTRMPNDGDLFYLDETIDVGGDCLTLEPATGWVHRVTVSPAGDVAATVSTGERVRVSFAGLGPHTIERVCEGPDGSRVMGTAAVEVLPPPAIAYRALGSSSAYVFANTLAENTPRRLSPEAEPTSLFTNLRYDPSGTVLSVEGTVGAGRTPGLLRACTQPPCSAPPLEPVYPHVDCPAAAFGWGPDGTWMWITYGCPGHEGLFFSPAQGGRLGTLRRLSDEIVRADIAGDGKWLVFKDERGTFRFDIRTPDEDPVWISDDPGVVVGNGRWLSASDSSGLAFVDLTGASAAEVIGSKAEYPWRVSSFSTITTSDTAVVVRYIDANQTPAYTTAAFRFDGSGSENLCADCWVTSCGKRLVAGAEPDGTPVVFETPLGGGAVDRRVLSGAPGMPKARRFRFRRGCTQLYYADTTSAVLIDLETGTWTMAPVGDLLGDDWLLTQLKNGFALHPLGADTNIPGAAATVQAANRTVMTPQLSPNGQEVLFVADLADPGDFHLYRLPLSTRTPRILAPDVSGDRGGVLIAFSPDGARVAVASNPARAWTSGRFAVNQVREYALSGDELLWTSPAPEIKRNYARAVQRIPGQRAVLFLSRREPSGYMHLFSADVDSAALVQHTDGQRARASLSDYSLSTDGSRLGMTNPGGAWLDRTPWTPEGKAQLAERVFPRPLPTDVLAHMLIHQVTSRGMLYGEVYPEHEAVGWLDGLTGRAQTLVEVAGQPTEWRRATVGPATASEGFIAPGRYPQPYPVHVVPVDQGQPGVVDPTLDFSAQSHLLTPDQRFLLYRTADELRVRDLVTGRDGNMVFPQLAENAAPIGWPPTRSYLAEHYDAGRYLFVHERTLYLVDLELMSFSAVARVCDRSAAFSQPGLEYALVCTYFQNVFRLELVDVSGRRAPQVVFEATAPEFRPKPVRVGPGYHAVVFEQGERTKLLATDASVPVRDLGRRIHPSHINFDRTGRYLMIQTGNAPQIYRTDRPSIDHIELPPGVDGITEVIWVD